MAEKKAPQPAADRDGAKEKAEHPVAQAGQVLTVEGGVAVWQPADAEQQAPAEAPQEQPRRLDEAERPGGKYRVNGRFVDASGAPIEE